MKKKVLIILILGTAAFLLYSYTKSPRSYITNFNSLNSGVVAFGDSLTYGLGSTEGGGWVKMISDDLHIPITNLGVTGNTTQDALDRITQVTERKPRVTIVLLGGNDFLTRVPEETTFKNLGEIIQKIEATGSAVLLVGLEPQINGAHDGELFSKMAEKYHTAYVPDILEGIYGHLDKMYSDHLHPNAAGYRLMASRIEPMLKTLLK